MSSARRRIDGVDLLRGLAIFFVLMNHVNMRLRIAKIPYTQGVPEHLVNALVWNGEQGVRIFFAVSGFLITTTALQRWGSISDVSPRRFYLLRFARIAPLLLLLLAVLSGLHFAGLSDFVVKAKTGGLGRALFAALTFQVNVLEANRGYLPGSWDILWSLGVEEVFYLFFPLACMLFGRGRLLILLLVSFILIGPFSRTVLAGHNGTWREYSYLGGMDAIALGCLTALISWRKQYSLRVLRVLTAGGLTIMTACLCFTNELDRLGLGRTGLLLTLLAVGTCMVIAATAQSGWSRPRIARPLASLGERSYEVYLTHMFVVFAFFDLFMLAGKPMRAVPWLFIVTILVASVLGGLVARLYSEPMNRWIRRNCALETRPIELAANAAN